MSDMWKEEFWDKLLSCAIQKGFDLHGHIGSRVDNAIEATSGFKWIKYRYIIRRGYFVGVEVYIDAHGNRLHAKAVFDQLMTRRSVIEKSYGRVLDWERLDGQKHSRVRDLFEIQLNPDRSNWQSAYEQLTDAMRNLYDAIQPHLQGVVNHAFEQSIDFHGNIPTIKALPTEVLIEGDCLPDERSEGGKVLRTVLVNERDPKIIAMAKAYAEQIDDLRCEVCKMSFSEMYGDRGEGFIEAHHRLPFDGEERTIKMVPEEIKKYIALLCSNCHRMIHRTNPAITVENLTKIWNEHDSA